LIQIDDRGGSVAPFGLLSRILARRSKSCDTKNNAVARGTAFLFLPTR
jgi:hypothetical protein